MRTPLVWLLTLGLWLPGTARAQELGDLTFRGNILLIGDSVWTIISGGLETIESRATTDGYLTTFQARGGSGVETSCISIFGRFCIDLFTDQTAYWVTRLQTLEATGALAGVTCRVISLGANDRNSDLSVEGIEAIYEAAGGAANTFWYLPQLSTTAPPTLQEKRAKIQSVVPANRQIDVRYELGPDGTHPNAAGIDQIMLLGVEPACDSL